MEMPVLHAFFAGMLVGVKMKVEQETTATWKNFFIRSWAPVARAAPGHILYNMLIMVGPISHRLVISLAFVNPPT